MNGQLENCLVYAARYAHDRQTGASFQIVSAILSHWDLISVDTKKTLIKEAKKATYNKEDWGRLTSKAASAPR